MKDMQQNLNLNKEIIRSLIEAQTKAGETQNKLLLETVENLRRENQNLQ